MQFPLGAYFHALLYIFTYTNSHGESKLNMHFLGHRPGSLRETLAISLPLMLAALSIYLMYFFERCVLAWFSLDALNAAVQASSLSWAFWGGMTIMAGMTEIFVSRSNYLGQCKTIGQTVWQTIWLSLAVAVILIPIGLFASHYFYRPHSAEESYFRLSMIFGALNPLVYTLTTFFVGRGRVKWILALTLTTSLFNAALDYILIFGVGSWLPSLGATGAAIASSITLSLQSTILLLVFLKKNNREHFGTNEWRPHLSMMFNFVKVSAFPAILYNVELWGWSVFYSMMAATGNVHITVSSLCQSLIYLFTFIAEGLSRGTALQASTYFASGNIRTIRNLLRSAGLILIVCFSLQVLFLAINPDLFLSMFLPMDEGTSTLIPLIQICTWLVLLYLLLQGFQWLLSGLLCAAGQTLPMTLCGVSGLLLGLLVPTYFFIARKGYSVEWAWALVVVYSLFCCSAYFWLFKRVRKQLAQTASTSDLPQPASEMVPMPAENFYAERVAAQ